MKPVDITDNLVETQKLLTVGGISFPTLRKYHRLGWIDEPKLRSYDGQRRGKSLWWKRSTISKLEMIKTLKGLKKTDSEITQILKGE